MKKLRFDLHWLREYSLKELDACYERMRTYGVLIRNRAAENIQSELIRNPGFAEFYAGLLSSEDFSTERLESLLDNCQSCNLDITRYKAADVLDVLKCEPLDAYTRLVMLKNFSPTDLTEEAKENLVRSLANCTDLPLKLNDKEKTFLKEAFVGSSFLMTTAPFKEVFTLLDTHPALLGVASLLQKRGVPEKLALKDYTAFADSLASYLPLMEAVFSVLAPTALGFFLKHWQHNGCPLRELQTMKRLMDAEAGRDWEPMLETASSYTNTLYGARFKNIDLSSVRAYQEGLLIYAIAHNKKHFIRLVDENAETFCQLPYTSVLFQEELYSEHFNINELTEKSLAECHDLPYSYFHFELLEPGRRYSFQELKALNGKASEYWLFYNLMRSESQDYRLQVFRQVCKKDVLRGLQEEEIQTLAAMLDKKPLYDWREKDFGHIGGLVAAEVVQLLLHMENLRHLVPTMRNPEDVSQALRCVEMAGQFSSMGELKNSLMQTDSEWLALAQRMGLTPEFLAQNKACILSFLCKDGASIAQTYLNRLKNEQQEAFLRVVKAERMGRFGELKYHADDLQKELDAPLPGWLLDGWKQNLRLVQDGITVEEHDDFFSTMLVGEQPLWTCLSYKDGAYSECLLSGFDSNKKLLYARAGGKVVGRAFLRLTKASLTGSREPATSLAFADLEHPDAQEEQNQEKIVLFLERPYIGYVDPDTRKEIEAMLVKIAMQKADSLGVMLVLSLDYCQVDTSEFTRTRLCLYISKSKAGKQYLDSLDGEAGISSEGSYRANSFIVRQANV